MNRILLLLLVVSHVGCSYPTFSNPIVEPQSAKRYEELFGVYQTKHPDDGEMSWLHIGRGRDGLPDGMHKFVWVSPTTPKTNDQGLTVSEYLGFVFKNGDSYIVQIPYNKDCGDKQASVIAEQWGKSEIDNYYYVRFKRTGDNLRLDLLVEENVEQLIRLEKLGGLIEQKIDESTVPPTIGRKSVTVTAKTNELAEFFKTNDHDDIFEPSGYTFTKQNAR